MSDRTQEALRLGLLGGSFDPVHFGHIKPALQLAAAVELDKISFIPCKVSPFKNHSIASARHRYNMLSIIAASSELFDVDSRELQRETPSYSYETLKDIASEHGAEVTLFWIMGEDALLDFPRWHQAEKIMQLCHVLVLRRPGYDVKDHAQTQAWIAPYLCHQQEQLGTKKSGYIYFSEVALLEISSTQIRQMIRAGEQPRFLLPGAVWNYIQRNKLYQNTTSTQ